MKVTLDIDKLLKEGKITQKEYDKILKLSSKHTTLTLLNTFLGFSIIAISLSMLAIFPSLYLSVAIGVFLITIGLILLHKKINEWIFFANISILIGSLIATIGIFILSKGSMASLLFITILYTATSILAKSSLLAILATLSLSTIIGNQTGYLMHGVYFISIPKPTITIVIFSLLAYLMYRVSKKVSQEYKHIAIASARMSIFLVNLAFWIGSIWGEDDISSSIFAISWAIILIGVAIWSWRDNRVWLFNTTAIFGGIHFYTQWFEHLAAKPISLLIGGLIGLGFAIGLKVANKKLEKR